MIHYGFMVEIKDEDGIYRRDIFRPHTELDPLKEACDFAKYFEQYGFKCTVQELFVGPEIDLEEE